MGDANKQTTEEKILIAAEDIFTAKGYTGARMQEIADAAGINKAMLHYYFRSKEKLFQVILGKAIDQVSPLLQKCLTSDKAVQQKLEDLVDIHLNNLSEKPHLPMFIMHEMSQNQGALMSQKMLEQNTPQVLLAFFQQVMEEGEIGKIRVVDPLQLFMNTMSLIIFPFIVLSTAHSVMGSVAQLKSVADMLETRRSEVKRLIGLSLRPD